MWHPGRTGRQPCGPQNICPDPAVFAAARFAGFCSWADAPVTAKTSAPAKIHFIDVICYSSPVFEFTTIYVQLQLNRNLTSF
jgi:hypothetical protein